MKSANVWVVGLLVFVGIMWFALGSKQSKSTTSTPASTPKLTLAQAKAKVEAASPKTLGDVAPIFGEKESGDTFIGCKKDEYFGHANCTWVFTDGRMVVEAEHDRNFAKVRRVQYIDHK
jgi:hypothetical protein